MTYLAIGYATGAALVGFHAFSDTRKHLPLCMAATSSVLFAALWPVLAVAAVMSLIWSARR